QFLQHRPLLDVKFDESQNVVAQSCFGKFVRVQTKILIALRTEIPSASLRARSSSSSLLRSARLPMNGTPNRTPSSSENPMTSIANGSFNPRKDSTSSIARTTPNIPSNAPAFGTVSKCDPIRIRGADGDAAE